MIAHQLPQPGAHLRRRGARMLALGAVVTVVGASISLVTYLAARAEGDTVIVVVGPLLLGLVLLVAGWGSVLRARGEAAAGWHVDPTGRHSRRYWDGARWTERVADGGQEAADPPQGEMLQSLEQAQEIRRVVHSS